nr:AlpA family phage regulatory protein [Komagataeibacter xylinus]
MRNEPALAQLLTAREVADRLRITTRTLYRKLERGGFPKPVRLGPQCVRWDEGDVRAWVDKMRVSESVM